VIKDGNSAVILMHDFHVGRRRKMSTDAGKPWIVTRISDYFKEKKYRFVTMNECYQLGKADFDSKEVSKGVSKGNGGPSPWPDVYIP
jgi:hypothetical protein